jgi:rhamnulokinase
LQDVVTIDGYEAFLFPDDQRFFNPPSMLDAIRIHLRETAQTMPNEPAVIAKVILDSLAFRYASVVRTIESLTKQKIEGIQIIGGGSQNSYLNQTTANATGLPVIAGPVEATVVGNVLVQSIACGRFANLADARQYIARNVLLQHHAPQYSSACEEAKSRYRAIEACYI